MSPDGEQDGAPSVEESNRKPMLSIRGLSKTYRDFWGRRRVEALRSVDLEVGSREILGLLGPNGSGKTTLLKALLGLVRPTSGTAAIGGEPAGSLAARRLCGYLPEESTLPKSFTLREVLDLFGDVVGLARARRTAEVQALILALGLEEFASLRLRQLSRGTLRRVGLALALLGDPPLLLLDEPTSGMDPLAAARVRDELRRRREEGRTVVLSTHLASDVEGMCDRVAILAHGRLLIVDSVERLLARPGVTRILASGIPPSGLDAVLRAVTSESGTVLEVGPARDSLERVFERTLRGDAFSVPSDRS